MPPPTAAAPAADVCALLGTLGIFPRFTNSDDETSDTSASILSALRTRRTGLPFTETVRRRKLPPSFFKKTVFVMTSPSFDAHETVDLAECVDDAESLPFVFVLTRRVLAGGFVPPDDTEELLD